MRQAGPVAQCFLDDCAEDVARQQSGAFCEEAKNDLVQEVSDTASIVQPIMAVPARAQILRKSGEAARGIFRDRLRREIGAQRRRIIEASPQELAIGSVVEITQPDGMGD